LFGFDQAALRPEGQMMLGRLASALNSVAFAQSIVVGHTDSWGSTQYNDRLSLRRAESVKAYLVSQGVPAAKITTQGMGERELMVDPKACKGTKAARQACEQPNRRVSIGLNGVTVPSNQVQKWQDSLRAVGATIVN
jgi:OmpA-OmpF porin, OOP family